MSEINKTYRIRTDIGKNLTDNYITIDANLVQDYDTFDILSVKINSVDTYKLHNANYGVVVGRVLANNGFGIPNAKLSIFIDADSDDGEKIKELYPFSNTVSKNSKGIRYNLLPDDKVDDCHQVVGTFPNKRFALDNDVVLEVFDKYYKYTTRTNNAGDYIIMGVPVGTHTLHMDLDLSDCGILSQRPRDFVYKGYTIEQFENPNMFKEGTEYTNLSQIFTQDQVVNIQPFWGNSSLGEKIGITRADINVAFKFEPTCVFIGSVISDNSSQGISKKCIPTENMGNMEELTTGEGTIEMIRKTQGGSVEEFQVKGTQLIDGNGVWCYQIPMNLDYMTTDEYGNMVPTDDPEKGIPTRSRVRFRVSMQDNEENVDNFFRAKILVPHNPQILDDGKHEDYDYEFGSLTNENSFRDLFWNNVYSVKSYIPRFQKRKVGGWKEKKFTGIKNCNFYGSNNPMPYNNIRIKLPFMFTVMCALIKVFIFIVSIMNSLTSMLGNFLCDLGDTYIGFKISKWRVGFYPFKNLYKQSLTLSMNVLKEGLCPDLENWYFAPMFRNNLWSSKKQPPKDMPKYDLLKQTLEKIRNASADDDFESIDYQNNEEMDSGGEEPICLTIHTDYLISCVEMNLAMEYKVINFDFYNDWVNGTLYFPRFMRYIRPKKKFLGITFLRSKVKGCMDDTKIFSKTRRYTQQCALGFKNQNVNGSGVFTNVENPLAKKKNIKAANNLHKQRGLSQKTIFGKNGGICHEQTTLKGQYVYYMKPCEWTYGTSPNEKKVNLFATDIILLGSLNDCDINGVPQSFKYLSSSSYIMPTNLALTNMENSSFLYVTDNGSICAGNSQLDATDVKNESKVNILPSNAGLTGEILAFSGAQDSNYNVMYDGQELSDIIALTESAGISWNYTGPGQGEMDPEKFYYPGGHFLGLSCINSQTNIKSCINLTRICEVGANMSQRKEDVSSIDKDGNVVYTYTVPTGFISGDDIVGSNFRTMFATMNYKRLIATKTNPTTGYKMYDFEYIKPINFDGTFKSVVSNRNSSNLYNGKVITPEEDESIWEKIGIIYNADSRPDHDASETANTQTRTIEDTSIDYYLYRFGLNYDDLSKSNQKHLKRFLATDGSKLYLPQYENSYYFYFGLKNGATAIDEFNKQFFSECANGMLLGGEPSVNITVDGDIHICSGMADVKIITTNLESPYQSIEIVSDSEFSGSTYNDVDKTYNILVRAGDENSVYSSWLTSYMFVLKNCKLGAYTVIIRDANDIIYTKTQKIGSDVLSFDSAIYDFNTTDYLDNSYLHRGGYIELSNLKIDGLTENMTLTAYTCNASGNVFETKITNGLQDSKLLPVFGIGDYELRVKYKCSNGPLVDMILQTFTINDNSSLKLFIGYQTNKHNPFTHETHSYGWWEKNEFNDMWIEKISTFNETLDRKENTSSINVYAEGGIKAVWGCPQNSNGIKTDEVWSTEDTYSWENGYAVDDEFVHYPTYKYKGSQVTPFSTIVYNGTTVMGDYEAKMEDGDVNVSSSKLRYGCGYVFKPVPDGELQFHVYNGSAYTANTSEAKYGVFYPSISYPSVDRPFCAITSFFCWSRRAVDLLPNEEGETVPTLMDYEEGSRTEMKVINGITHDKKFYKNSYISNLPDFNFVVENVDTYGLKNPVAEDRITVFSGYSDGVSIEEIEDPKFTFISKGNSGVTTYSYEIIEGAPDNNEKALTLCNSLYSNLESLFADYVRYAVDDNKKIVGPVGEGGTESVENDETDGIRVRYYMAVCKNSTNSLILQSDEKYLYTSSKNNKVHYVLCSYTSASTYDDEGAPVLVKITTDDNIKVNKPDKVWVSYKCKDENGDTVTWNSGKIKFDKESKTKNIITLFENVFSHCKGIQGVVDYRINYNKNEWTETLQNDKISSIHKYDTKNIYYAYGVIEDKESGTKLYKIYPTPVKVTEVPEPIYTTISLPETTHTFERTGGTRSFTLTNVSSNKQWVCSYEGNEDEWFKISPESGVGSSTSIKIDLRVNENNTIEDRQGIIYFYYQNDGIDKENDAKYTIIQKAKDPITATTYTISNDVGLSVFSMPKIEVQDGPNTSLPTGATHSFMGLTNISIEVDNDSRYEITLPKLETEDNKYELSHVVVTLTGSKYEISKTIETAKFNEDYTLDLGKIDGVISSGSYKLSISGFILYNGIKCDVDYIIKKGTYEIKKK